jgi:hypothetical protein
MVEKIMGNMAKNANFDTKIKIFRIVRKNS